MKGEQKDTLREYRNEAEQAHTVLLLILLAY